jgi:RNA recognition motif-containing protein
MNIYVGNLSNGTAEPQLREKFEKYGKVAAVDIKSSRDEGKQRTYGFVEMPSNEHAQAAIAGLHGKELSGNMLKVNEARQRE